MKKIIFYGTLIYNNALSRCCVTITYKKLWKLLIDKDMKKKDLIALAGVSNYTLNRLTRSENVNTDTLIKICNALHCQLEDIMELKNDEI